MRTLGGEHPPAVRFNMSTTTSSNISSSVVELRGEPAGRGRQHRSPPERSPEGARLRQELLPVRVLGPRGDKDGRRIPLQRRDVL